MNLLEHFSRVPTLTIADAKMIVEGLLGTPVSLVDPDSLNPRTHQPREVRSDATLQNRLRTGKRIELRAIFQRDADQHDVTECRGGVGADSSVEPSTPRARANELVLASNEADACDDSRSSDDVMLERFIREMELQERRRDFVWIGYVAKTMLPSFGLGEAETHAFLQRVEADELITRSQRPNPKNPEFPSTGITLNREHPTVSSVLRGNGCSKKFQPVPIRGEPASATLIRDRR